MRERFTSHAPRHPRARFADSTSSHKAAAILEATGQDKRQASKVLAAFKRFPMATTAEVAKLAKLNRFLVARRAPELARDGMLKRYEPSAATKPCEVTGIRCVRWRVA